MRHCFLAFLIFGVGVVYSQDLIYTVSARYGSSFSPLDSIVVENVSNGSTILFGNLPPRRDYIINLTQRAFQGTTSSEMTRQNTFSVSNHQPGEVIIHSGESTSGKGSVSLYSLTGQKILEEHDFYFSPHHTYLLKVGIPGYFLVRMTCNGVSNAFKIQGSSSGGSIGIQSLARAGNSGSLKKGTASGTMDFQFFPGDSLRISVFRKSYYAYPKSFRIMHSADLDFSLTGNTALSSGISNAYVHLYGNYVLNSFELSSGVALLSPVGSSEPLKYGDIFVAENDTSGYLRKVINAVMKDGNCVVKTVPAGLNEVFVNKELKMSTLWMAPLLTVNSQSHPADISRAMTDAAGFLHPVMYVIQKGGGQQEFRSPLKSPGTDQPLIPAILVNKSNITAGMTGGNQLQFSLKNGAVMLSQEGELVLRFRGKGRTDAATKSDLGEVEWGRAIVSGQGKINGDAKVITGASDFKLPEQGLMPLQKVTLKFLIDGIPVWMDVMVNLNQKVVMSSLGSLSASWNIGQTVSFGNGWEYSTEKGAFSPLFSGSAESGPHPVSLSGNSDGNVYLSFYPSTEMSVYGVPVMSARQLPVTDIRHKASIQQVTTTAGIREFSAWNSQFLEGGDYQVSGDLSAAGRQDLKFDSGVLELKRTTPWTSPVKLTLQPLGEKKVHLSSMVNLLFRVTDSSGLPVPGCAVFLQGDGSFREQLVLSNAAGEVSFDWTVAAKPGFNDFSARIYNATKEVISSVRDSVEVFDKDAYGTLTVDGKVYKTKKFGNAVWMVENLAYLPSVTPPLPGSNTDPYYYVYGYNGTSVEEAKQVPGYSLYGVFYNWKAATKGETPPSGGTIRGICPTGWHIPGQQDWEELWAYLVNNGYGFGGSGNRIAKAMASKTGWNTTSFSGTPGNDPASNNSSEFNALPGGFRCTDALNFVQKGMFTSWWTAAPRDEINGYHWGFYYNTSHLLKYYSPKGRGYFVRCVKD